MENEAPEILSEKELIDAFVDNTLPLIVFNDIKHNIEEQESNKLTGSISELIQENMLLGGSEHGFFFDNELFAISSTFEMGDIKPIDESLYSRASGIKKDREELAQDMTYFGNFLSVLGSETSNYVVFLANMPIEFATLSPNLKVLQRKATEDLSGWREAYAIDRTISQFTVLFMHYDRVEPRLKRYLFRKVTS